MQRTLYWLLLSATLPPIGSASAQEESVYLEYQAGPGCPARAEFVEQVRARTARARFVDDPRGVRQLTVTAVTEGDHANGWLASGRDGAMGKPRAVTSSDCAAVVAALALMTALAMDPRASTPAQSDEPRAGASAGPPPAPTSPSPTTPTAEAPRRLPAASSPFPTFRYGSPPGTRSAPTGSLLAGLRGGGSLWFDPTPVPFGTLAAAVEWEAHRAPLWAPAVRLSAGLELSPTVRPAAGSANFRLVTGTLDLCPLRMALSGSVALRPCLALEGGVVVAKGGMRASITHAWQRVRPWWALHQALRLQMDLGQEWLFELEGRIIEPLRRYDFVFETPHQHILEVPGVAPSLALGLARRFY